MGKRELVLIAAFVALGSVVYWFRAAPPPDEEAGLSLGRLARSVRAEISGRRATHAVGVKAQAAVSADLTAVEVEGFEGALVAIGTDTHTVDAELSGEAAGLDESEALAAAEETQLSLEPHGDALRLVLHRPRPRLSRRQPNLTLTLTMPAGLHLRLVEHRGTLEVRDVGAVTLDRVRAEVRITDISGPVTGRIERSSNNDISRVGLVELEGERAELIVSDVRGPATVRAEQGHVYLSRVHGPITVNGDRADIDVDANHAPLVVEARRGKLALHDARAPVVVDGERLDVRLTMTESVPVTVTNRDARVDITLPAGAGVHLEATARGGRLSVPSALRVDESGDAQHARGTIGGGGAPVVVEIRNGTLVIRQPASFGS